MFQSSDILHGDYRKPYWIIAEYTSQRVIVISDNNINQNVHEVVIENDIHNLIKKKKGYFFLLQKD